MKSIEGIKNGIKNNDDTITIARKLYPSYSNEVFKDQEDKEFYIKNSISQKFNVPFSSIEIVGSGKTGLSFFKDKLFEPGISDLDIAIISLPLFNKFSELAHKVSNGYSNLTEFPFFNGQRTDKQFRTRECSLNCVIVQTSILLS